MIGTVNADQICILSKKCLLSRLKRLSETSMFCHATATHLHEFFFAFSHWLPFLSSSSMRYTFFQPTFLSYSTNDNVYPIRVKRNCRARKCKDNGCLSVPCASESVGLNPSLSRCLVIRNCAFELFRIAPVSRHL